MFTTEGFGFIDTVGYIRSGPIAFVFVFYDNTADPYFYIGSTSCGTNRIPGLLMAVRSYKARNEAESIAKMREPKTYFLPAVSKAGANELKKELISKYATDEKCLNLTGHELKRHAGVNTPQKEPEKVEVKRPLTPLEIARKNRLRPRWQLSSAYSRPVRVGARAYPSIASAARDNGCSESSARKRLMSDDFPDWKFAEFEKRYYR